MDRRLAWAALCAAAAMGGAGSAAATIVQANFSGRYWTIGAPNGWAEANYQVPPGNTIGGVEIVNGPTGEIVNLVYSSVAWTANFVFDTEQGLLTEQPFGSSGGTFETLTASPILSGGFSAPGFPAAQNLAGAMLAISLGPQGFALTITNGFTISTTVTANQLPPPDQDSYRLSDAWDLPETNLPYYVDKGGLYQDGVFSASEGAVSQGRLRPLAPVPEPTTWVITILGFLATGVALRRGRLGATGRRRTS